MFFKKYRKKTEGAIRFYDLHSPGTRFATVLIFLAAVVFLVIALFPMFWVAVSGFKDIQELRLTTSILPKSFDINSYVKTWNDFKFGKYYLNSFISVAGGVVCALLFNGTIAYVLAILKPRGHKVVFALVMWSLLIPPTTGIVALFVNIKRIGLTGSFLPLWLSMGANAFWVVLFKQFFEGLPREYFEAAQLDGCSDWRMFWNIVLPLSKPILMVVAIFAVTAAWSDFLLPYLVLSGSGKETVMVRLFNFRTAIKHTDVDLIRAIVFSVIPPTIIFAIFQKQITQGIAAGGIKG